MRAGLQEPGPEDMTFLERSQQRLLGLLRSSEGSIFRGSAFSVVLGALGLIVAHFAQSRRFGLYDDDFGFIPMAWHMSGQDLLRFSARQLLFQDGLGRPLQFIFMYSF